MCKRQMLIIVTLLFFSSLLSAQANTKLNEERKTVLAHSDDSSINVIPKELIGSWILDKVASISFAKQSPRWNTNIEKLLPKLLLINKKENLQFTDKQFIVNANDKQSATPIILINQDKNNYYFRLSQDDKYTELILSKKHDGRINIQSENLLGSEFLIWKKSK